MQYNPQKSVWRDTKSWRGGWLNIYVAPGDPRVWVPKISGMGWTLNFAHGASWWWLAGLLGVPMVFVFVMWFFLRGTN